MSYCERNTSRILKSAGQFFGGFMFAVFSLPALAQTEFGLEEKAIERANSARKVGVLSVDNVFGDERSGYNGAVDFNNVDISIPGNSALPVELRRNLKVDDRLRANGNHLGGFAEWDLDLPHLSGVFADYAGGWKPVGGTVNQRCSLPRPPAATYGFILATEYWDGYNLHVPSEGTEMLLHSPNALLPSPATGTFPWLTKKMWRVSCKAGTKNGYAGEAFIALSPEGLKYTLDWAVTKTHAGIKNRASGVGDTRKAIYFLASRVEDRYGNWVDYTYSGDKLTGITSNDGRQISLNYSGNKIVSATSSIGTWTYSYVGEKLSQVTRPDSSKWSYASTGALHLYPPVWSPQPEQVPEDCPDPIEFGIGQYSITVTAPSGAVGQFAFEPRRHYRSNVPPVCHVTSTSSWYMPVPRYLESFTLLSKTISGPGLTSGSWAFEYGTPNWLDGEDFKQNTALEPDGTYQRETYGTGWGTNDGRLLSSEIGSGPSTILRTEATTYVSTAQTAGQSFPSDVGVDPHTDHDLTTTQLRPIIARSISQDGATFNYKVRTDCAGRLCYDSLARPTRTDKWSSGTVSDSTRTDATVYYDNTSKWVLGQIQSQTNLNTGLIVAAKVFDAATANPLQLSSFGKLKATITYNADGTIATVKDGNNNITSASSWKRGIPQVVTFPATPESPGGTTQTAVVGDTGWVNSVTDENGFTTTFSYDVMGRTSGITHPAGDTTAWNPTLITYEQRPVAAYGLPAGHWRRWERTGNAWSFTYYDALFQPVLEERYDTGSVATTLSQTVRRYDLGGRVAFQSYPTSSVSTFQSVNQGARTTYDALGRTTSIDQDSELGVLTTTNQHANGFQTVVTNPRGFQTVTQYQAFDEPSTSAPTGITMLAGADAAAVEVIRDVFGKPMKLSKRNSADTLRVDRRFVYNGYQELCKTIEPENGATVMSYDGAGNLSWAAAGHIDLLDPASCNNAEGYWWGRRVDRTYDARNRLTQLIFPDNRGSQVWSYTPDGLPQQITTYNEIGNTVPVVNGYSYNKRRLLVGESVAQTGWYTWPLGYIYDANASLETQTYPTGLSIGYSPNALGQATRAGSYATGVQYFPNGAVKQFTYGNGIVHTLQQNARLLPSRSTDSANALDHAYTYDKHANVTQIADYIVGAPTAQSRYMTYDGLDRLTGVGSAMFGGSDHWHFFTYDALDNLKSWKQSGIKDYSDYVYTSNRLTNVKNSAASTIVGLDYDVQGNLHNKNGQIFDFDFGNRLRNVPNKESYIYDGHGRRVQTTKPDGSKTLWQYNQSGQMLFSWNGPGSEKTHENVYLAGSLVAIIDHDWPSNAIIATSYQHTDALGSPVAVTNAAGVVTDRTNHEPFGAAINKPTYNGIGYTGHVQDGVTGLTYMQQRYYDPIIGRFLSVDPVTAYENPIGAFNRYWYANNNPYKFTDPDGRLVQYSFSGGATVGDGAAVLNHWMKSETIMGELSQILKSDQTYTVAFNRGGEFVYDDKTRTINIDVTSGLRVGSSGEIQSPALGGGHEVSHAAEHDRVGNKAFEKASTPPQTGGLENGVMKVKVGTSREEVRATRIESKAAKELGEPARKSYKDESGSVKVCSPTSNKAC